MEQKGAAWRDINLAIPVPGQSMMRDTTLRRHMKPENNERIRFFYQESKDQTWPEMQAEHELLANALRVEPDNGYMAYERVIAPTQGAALYPVSGIGMHQEQSFALVQAGEIVWVEANRDEFKRDEYRVWWVRIPENFDGRREQLVALIAEAVAVYYFSAPWFPEETKPTVTVDKVKWDVIPRRYSWLFWKTEGADWWDEHKYTFGRVWSVVKSPVVALIGIAAAFYSRVNGYSGILPLIIVAAWFWYLADNYDGDVYFWSWLVGVGKFKSPWGPLKNIMGRLEAVPLPALTVTVRLDPATPGMCTLRIRNTSAFVVTHLSISAHAIADLIAPGYIDSQREANGGLEMGKIDAAFPNRTRRWLLPFQAFEWQVPMRPEFPLVTLGAEVEAMVCISKHVSGQRTSGAQVYTLPVRWA